MNRIKPPTDSADEPKIKARNVSQMGGFAKGLRVIEALGASRSSLTIADIARNSGLDRATARRCVLTLVNIGYAASDGRHFQLTPRVLRLAHSFLTGRLPTLIQPSLEILANRMQESCSAAVLDGSEIVYIARASQHRLMGAGLHRGSRLPAFCTSMGRVLLAALPVEQSLTLLRDSERPAITERTLTEVDQLMSELERIRVDGYAVIDQELALGSRSMAVPIATGSGHTVAAINVGIPTLRSSLEQLRVNVLPMLVEAQARLSQVLAQGTSV